MRKGIHIRPGVVRGGLVLLTAAVVVVAVREYPAVRRYVSIATM